MKRVAPASLLALGFLSASIVTVGSNGRSPLQLLGRVHGPVALIKKGVAANWSGFAAGTNLDLPVSQTVSDVSGSWTVPTLSCGVDDTFSASWVGIDGYSNSTVEQIGTEADCSSGSPSYYAWFEMYPQPGYLLNPAIFPVEAGDHISASVHFAGSGNFDLSITSDNPDWVTNYGSATFSITKKLTRAQRTSAEWIVEAPGRSTMTLANFGTFSFTGAGWIGGGISHDIDDVDYDPITKVGTETATPSPLVNPGSSFNVSYGNSTTSDHSYVADIAYSFTHKAGGALFVTVSIVDNLGDPVANANVSVSVSGGGGYAFSGATGSNGAVTFTISGPASGTYSTQVTSVTNAPSWDGVTPPNGSTVK